MARAEANGIAMELEREGDPGAPAILLICGLGTQLIDWGPTFVQRLLAAGFQVVRFDNRDAGLSHKFGESGEDAPYTIADMAADAIGVLDALGIGKAHIVRRSMGGIIAQPLAWLEQSPERECQQSAMQWSHSFLILSAFERCVWYRLCPSRFRLYTSPDRRPPSSG